MMHTFLKTPLLRSALMAFSPGMVHAEEAMKQGQTRYGALKSIRVRFEMTSGYFKALFPPGRRSCRFPRIIGGVGEASDARSVSRSCQEAEGDAQAKSWARLLGHEGFLETASYGDEFI